MGYAFPWLAYAANAVLILTLAVVGVTAWAYLHGGVTYLDNGDGLYLYPARRLAQGAALYRGVMATQPPLVYLLYAAAFKAGLSSAGVHLLGAAMRASCVALVYVLGLRLFGNRLTAALAGLLYALLPLGLAWDRSINSNSPLTLLLLFAAYALACESARSARLAGLLAVLALFTKDLYLPVLVTTLLYLVRQRRALLAPYLHGLLGGALAAVLALLVYAGPRALRDAFLGQDASPLNLNWFIASLAYVVSNEGGIVLAALCGAWLCLRSRLSACGDANGGREYYAAYVLLGSAAVLAATVKEGTFGTVFQSAEPAVALLAAHALAWAAGAFHRGGRAAVPGGVLIVVCALACAGIAGSDRAALATNNSAEVAHVAALVRRHAAPGSVILAPPYYAVLSGTRVPGDVSDTYIMAQRARNSDATALAWVRTIRQAISKQQYPVVVVDQHIATLPGVMAALARRYHPVYADTLPPSIHAVVWLPNGSPS